MQPPPPPPPQAHTSNTKCAGRKKKSTTMHKETVRCEHCSNHQMRRMLSKPSANKPPALNEVPAYSTRAGLRPARREVPATGVATGP